MLRVQSRRGAADSGCGPELVNDEEADEAKAGADDDDDADADSVLSDTPLDDDGSDEVPTAVPPPLLAAEEASASAAKLVPDEDATAVSDDDKEEDSDDDDEVGPSACESMLSCPRRTSSALAASNTVLASAHARSGERITSL